MTRNVCNVLLIIGLLVTFGCEPAATEPRIVEQAQQPLVTASLDLSEVEPLDLGGFIGKRQVLQGSFSSQIKQVNIGLDFPKNHKLITKANPDFLIYDADGQPLYKQHIHENQTQFVVSTPIKTSKAFLKLGVYYCKQGEEGLCMMQNMLYEVFVSNTGGSDVIDLNFELPPSYF